ncbi:hypothetical protein P3S68_008167 [Capsicum galapagoense]
MVAISAYISFQKLLALVAQTLICLPGRTRRTLVNLAFLLKSRLNRFGGAVGEAKGCQQSNVKTEGTKHWEQGETVPSFGGSNIDPSAWEDKKNPSECRFPTQLLSNDSKSCLLKPSIKRLLAAESPQGVLRTPNTVAKSRSVQNEERDKENDEDIDLT